MILDESSSCTNALQVSHSPDAWTSHAGPTVSLLAPPEENARTLRIELPITSELSRMAATISST